MQEEEQIGLEATSYLAGIADQLCMYYGGRTVWTDIIGQIWKKKNEIVEWFKIF